MLQGSVFRLLSQGRTLMQMQTPRDLFDTEITLTSVGVWFLNSSVSRPESLRMLHPLGRCMCWLV